MTPSLTHCTLTGIDDHTDCGRVADLSSQYPIAEWGILYSASREGSARYPLRREVQRLVQELPQHVRVAVHFCGSTVRDLLSLRSPEVGLIENLAARNGRVQLNFAHTRVPIDINAVARLMRAFPTLTVITQDHQANVGLWREIAAFGCANYAVLFDRSGGRGISPAEWPAPLPVPCGYAGGLGPSNLSQELARIAERAGPRAVWIDMESRLRVTDETGGDRFDLEACRQCLLIASAHGGR